MATACAKCVARPALNKHVMQVEVVPGTFLNFKPYRLLDGRMVRFADEDLVTNIPTATLADLSGDVEGFYTRLLEIRKVLLDRSDPEGTGFDLVGQVIKQGASLPDVMIPDVLRYAMYQAALPAFIAGFFSGLQSNSLDTEINITNPFNIADLQEIILSYCGPRMEWKVVQKLSSRTVDEKVVASRWSEASQQKDKAKRFINAREAIQLQARNKPTAAPLEVVRFRRFQPRSANPYVESSDSSSSEDE
jgi:hypothetical protein